MTFTQEREAAAFAASSIPQALPLCCNTPDDVLYGNIRRCVLAGYPILQVKPPNGHKAIIVGSGPSLANDVEEIRQHQRDGAHIFALNGAGLWLQERGIIPSALIILDARPSNARFVKGLGLSVTLFIASQCDPSVFDAGSRHMIVAWHPNMEGKSGVVENRPTVLIGGSTSVGMRALRLVYFIGYREEHLYGYDSSYSDTEGHAFPQPENAGENLVECTVNGRVFHAAPWMIRQADDFPKIACDLIASGVSIHVHGDGLLPEVARGMRRNPSHAVYDLRRAPHSYDFLNWLVIAEMNRKRGEGEAPLKVAFIEGERNDGLPSADKKLMLEKVMRPSLALIGAVEDNAALDGGECFSPYVPAPITEAVKAGEPFPYLTAPQEAKAAVGDWLSERNIADPVVIVLREAKHWPQRNSRVLNWVRFAQSINRKAVVIRDADKADEPLSSLATCPEASRDIQFRFALYERAFCVMGVCAGPASVAIYTKAPLLLFCPRNVEGYLPSTDEWMRRNHGIGHGEQYPWLRSNQRIIWDYDHYAAIRSAWDEFNQLERNWVPWH